MPISKLTDKHNKKYYGYKRPSAKYIMEQNSLIYAIAEKAASLNGIPLSSFVVDEVALSNTVVRVDQRKEYYRIYHDNTILYEIRENALVAYWIMRYCPFASEEIVYLPTVQEKNKTTSLNVFNRKLNAKIALHIITSTIEEIFLNNGMPIETDLSDEYKNDFVHALSEQEITKEGVMLAAESLYAQYFRNSP